MLNSFLASGVFCFLCKQFGPRSGLKECRSWSGSNLFDTLIVFLKEFFEKVNFENRLQTAVKAWKIPSMQRVYPLSATYNLQQTPNSNFTAFSKITNKGWYFMRIVCQQTILMKYHTLFISKIVIFSKIGNDVAKFVVCCSCDRYFKGY